MTAVVERDDTEVFREFLVAREEVEVCGRRPAVEQDDRGRPVRAGEFPDVRGASARKMDVATGWQVGHEEVGQFDTFTTDTSMALPFSSVTFTESPAACPSRADPMGDDGDMISVPSRRSSMCPMR